MAKLFLFGFLSAMLQGARPPIFTSSNAEEFNYHLTHWPDSRLQFLFTRPESWRLVPIFLSVTCDRWVYTDQQVLLKQSIDLHTLLRYSIHPINSTQLCARPYTWTGAGMFHLSSLLHGVRPNSFFDHRSQFYLLRSCHSLNCIQAQHTGSSHHPSADGGNLNWDERKQKNNHLKTLTNNKHIVSCGSNNHLLSHFAGAGLGLSFKKNNKTTKPPPTHKQQTHQNPSLLKKLFTYHNFKTHQFEIFWHLKVNVEALTSSDTSGWACHFSSPLLPFIKPVLLNCSISLLSWIAIQIKSHFLSWLKSSSKFFSITSLKKFTA